MAVTVNTTNLANQVMATNTTALDNTVSFTVDADDDICIVFGGGYLSAADMSFDQLNWDGADTIVDFTLITEGGVNGGEHMMAYYMVATDSNWPTTGSNTIYYSCTADISDGGYIGVVCCQGVDTSNPIIGSDNYGSSSSTGQDWTSGSVGTVNPGDMGFIAGHLYAAISPINLTVNSQTALYDGGNNPLNGFSGRQGVAYKDGEDQMQFDGGSGGYLGAISFAIRAAAAADVQDVGYLAKKIRQQSFETLRRM